MPPFPPPRDPHSDDDPPPPSFLSSDPFSSDPFNEPSPSHQPDSTPLHPPTESAPSTIPSSIPPSSSSTSPPESTLTTSSSTLLQIGTAIVIGAMAANVIGFRYSRWAVGKDIHRAWENQQRRKASQGVSEQTARNARRRAAETEARRRMQSQMGEAEERRRRIEFDRRLKEERERRDETKRSYAEWERVFGGGGFRVRVDVEEMLKGMRRDGGVGIGEEVWREFLKEKGGRGRDGREEFADMFKMFEEMGRRKGNGGKAEDFDAFRFWERVDGTNWRGGGMGGGGDGVFGRASGGRRSYEMLGLKNGASDKEVKEAYRREVMKWHPDRYRGNDPELAARKFREVTEAYNEITKN